LISEVEVSGNEVPPSLIGRGKDQSRAVPVWPGGEPGSSPSEPVLNKEKILKQAYNSVS
jgi:hypothetical protein